MKPATKERIKGITRMLIAGLAYFTIVTVLIIIAKLVVHYITFVWNLIP